MKLDSTEVLIDSIYDIITTVECIGNWYGNSQV